MNFRPCIDLHGGEVKQIVGSTLNEDHSEELRINFTADKPSSWFANMYRRDALRGGHVIQLGPGNEKAATEALAAWPGGLQIGGGVTVENAGTWLDRGASHIIITSCVFKNSKVDYEYLGKLVSKVGRTRIVLDLSCRKKRGEYYIVTDH